MKPTQITELFANIRKTFVSFFSIFMFVALGVGIFLGISWAGPALQNAADGVFDKGRFHDFQVQFPYGLSDGDVEKLSQVDGVTQVEKVRQSFQVMKVSGNKITVKVQSLGQDINVPTIVEGTLPSHAGQIALNSAAAARLGLGVGESITFLQDADPQGGGLDLEDAATTDSDAL